MVKEKFWRPKISSEVAKTLEVNPNATFNRVMTVELSNDAWKDSLTFLIDKGLFVKWNGIWLTFTKFENWCDKNWGEGMDLKTLGNDYYLVVCPTTQDKDWILENGPFFIEGKGLNISTWTPNFNPSEASIEKTLIWIKLPGLPQEYKDSETLKQIGNHLGEFVMSEELVDPADYNMISRLCINWQTVHNRPDTLEIKTGMGVWKQKIMLEEDMELCAKCTNKIHPPGFCNTETKGKERMQQLLEKEIIRLTEGYHGENQWNEKDWQIHSHAEYNRDLVKGIKLIIVNYQKTIIDKTFMAETQLVNLFNKNKDLEESIEGCFHINTGNAGSLSGDGIGEGDKREVAFAEEGSKIDPLENRALPQVEATSSTQMCKVNFKATQEGTKKATPTPNATNFVMDNII
ncbi:hypothetical protein SUGI_0582960 [Cryptomeria japonica]|nr:hypothetical protein SUGI_0582960 [Cryptomeria japonica]